MVDLMPAQTVLTPADAGNQLQTNGLDALGLTIPALSTAWSASSVGPVDDDALTLTVASPLAPFKGTLRRVASPSTYSQVTGAPITTPCDVLTLHPSAAQRLATLLATRLGGALDRPHPVALLVHGVPAPPATPQPMQWLHAGESMGLAGARTVSWHDARGLPIDPVAVAALFGDLVTAFPALVFGDAGMPGRATAGGLDSVIALAGGIAVRAHVISPHGAAYVPVRAVGRLELLDAGGAVVSEVPDSGLVSMSSTQRLGRAATHAADDTAAGDPLQWGLAVNGTMARAALAVPTLPAGTTLARQFLRVMCVDLPWHLLGNRGFADAGAPVPVDDATVPSFALPTVRATVTGFDYLVDGSDALGAMGAIAATLPPAPGVSFRALLTSAEIDPALALPPSPGAAGHWPAFPPPVPVGPPAGPILLRFTGLDAQALTATRRAGTPTQALDAVVTLPADAVPPGTHVRVMPRTFVVIESIGAGPSFVRGDGGAGIAVAGASTSVLLVNPFALDPGDTLPETLTVDLVLTGRDGSRRLMSSMDLALGAPAPFVESLAAFGGTALPGFPGLIDTLGSSSIFPSSLFGIPRTGPPGAVPTSILDMVRAFANETTAPRIGPHLPTQGRFETILAVGTGATPATPMTWTSVLTGARWAWESRCASPELGDPGNPAGPEVHAAGVRVGGQLGYDLAIHAIKRAQPIIPLSGAALGWLVQTGGDNWNEPPVDATGSVAGAMLETIAAICDSPELSLAPMPQPSDSIQSAVDALASALGVSAPTITIANEARLKKQLQREIATATHGQRDALWSLRRAIGQAREFVFIESPMFGRTSRSGSGPADIDLVQVLRQALHDNPRLKVMLCVPRYPDFSQQDQFAPYLRAAFAQRTEAVGVLTTEARTRVAAFHPIGFPGRATFVRSTVVVVDDVYALVGTSHWRRRGMSYDGGVDIASIDRTLNARGTSAAVARFRHELMATRLGVAVPTGPGTSSALWTRLAEPESAFDVLSDLLSGGGQGRCSPVWGGPTDTTVIAKNADQSDPNGAGDGPGLLALATGLFGDA